MLDATQTQALIGGINKATSLSDLFSGKANDPLSAINSVLSGNFTEYKGKETSLSALKTYVEDNVDDDSASSKLLADITVIENLFKMGNEEEYSNDPLYFMLSDNPDAFSDLPKGSVLNFLL